MININELKAAIARCDFEGDVLGLSAGECQDLVDMIEKQNHHVLELISAMEPVLVISDRMHDAWENAWDAIYKAKEDLK